MATLKAPLAANQFGLEINSEFRRSQQQLHIHMDCMRTDVIDALAAYRRMATRAGKIWLEHGASQYFECVEDDVKPGKWTSFPQSVKLKPGEVVMFSWIIYKSRAVRG